jgi:hypothetical protein
MKLGTLARISASPGGERVAKELAKSWGFGEISKLAKLNVELGTTSGIAHRLSLGAGAICYLRNVRGTGQ